MILAFIFLYVVAVRRSEGYACSLRDYHLPFFPSLRTNMYYQPALLPSEIEDYAISFMRSDKHTDFGTARLESHAVTVFTGQEAHSDGHRTA